MNMKIDLQRLIFENWGIKLVSLGLSLSLWCYVTSKGKAEITVAAPLELRNIPTGMTVVGNLPKNIEVRLHGQERALRDVTTERRVIGIIDISGAVAGDNIIRISPDDIKRPSGVVVSRISPYEIRVRLEPITRKSVRLDVHTRGNPAAGFMLAEASARPAVVTVEGPKSLLRSLSALRTVPIDISGAAKDLIIEQPKIEYQGRPLRIIEKDLKVRISIQKADSK